MLPNVKTSFPSLANGLFDNDIFDDFLKPINRGFSTPAVNITESNEDFRIDVAAPGLKKDDFKIDLHNNILTISSEQKSEEEEKNEKYVRREFSYCGFKRSFSLPQIVDAERIKASHENGVLKVFIPKREEAKDRGPRAISIN